MKGRDQVQIEFSGEWASTGRRISGREPEGPAAGEWRRKVAVRLLQVRLAGHHFSFSFGGSARGADFVGAECTRAATILAVAVSLIGSCGHRCGTGREC